MIGAKAMDPVLGVDIHIIQPPGPVPPLPVPHPFVGMLIDPMDFAPVIGATVMINGMPRATAGTGGQCVPPHIPIGGVFVKPPGNECEVFMGSATVLADGDPLGRLGSPALSCHDVGMPPPPRLKKKRKPKSLTLPTSVVLAIPAGAPVLVGGPPTISMMALGMKAAMAGLGKAFKKLKKLSKASRRMKALSKKVHNAAKKAMNKLGIPPSVQNRVHRAICTVTGHPVDVATGKVFTEAVDLELSASIPLCWERVWYSSSVYDGPLGHGWHHRYDLGLRAESGAVAVRLADGRGASFPPILPGDASVDVAEGLTLAREATGYTLRDREETTYHFADVGRRDELSVVRIERAGAELRFHHDTQGRLTHILDEAGRGAFLVWNGEGRIREVRALDPDQPPHSLPTARYDYSDTGDLRTVYDSLNQPFGYEYDNHLLVRETDRRGYSFFFRYDARAPGARCTHTWGEDGLFSVALAYEPDRTIATFDDGGSWTYEHDGNGLVTALVDPYGGVTRYALDDFGRVVEEIDPIGQSTSLEYADGGELIRRINAVGHPLPSDPTDSEPPDPNGYELPQTAREWEYGALVPAAMEFGSDEWIRSQLPPLVRDVAAQVTSAGTPRGEPVENFDRLGRLIERRYSDGSSEAWAYDPEDNVTSHRDREGAVTRYSYGSRNLLISETDPLGNSTSFEYSRSQELTGLVDAGGTRHRFVHDLKDRNTEIWTDGQLVDSYVYDAADHLVEHRDSDGRILVRYDIGPGGVDAIRSLAGGETHRFDYDSRGRIVLAETSALVAEFAYDEDGVQTRDLRDGEGVEHVIGEEGDPRKTIFLGRFPTRYERDPEDDDVLIVTDPTGAQHRFSVGWEGEVLKRLSNGTAELSLYDHEGRCHSKLAWRENAADRLRERRYLYSPGGNLQEVRDSESGTTRYEYDAAHRLAREIRRDGRTFDYAFDAAGNLLRQPGLAGVLMGRGNRLLQANGASFSFDNRGNLASRQGSGGEVRYRYDGLDRLTRIEIGEDTWEASYDPLGRRVSKSWKGRVTRYWWDDWRLAGEQGPTGAVRQYVYADIGSLVPFMFVEYPHLEADPAEGQRYFVFTSHIGVPVRVEDASGRPVWAAEIDPFGRAQVTLDLGVAMPLRFPGHYFDAETGLHCNRFRYYSPELGRYLEADPLGFESTVNLYAYPSNPLVEVDIDGLAKKPCASKPKKPKSKARKRTRPKKKQLKPGEKGSYEDLKKKTGKGKLDRDHIPSKAALLKRARTLKRSRLTKAQKKRIIDEADTVAVPKKVHQKGPTYGGKNTKKKIGTDAGDLETAAARDADAMVANAKKHYGKDRVPESITDAADELRETTNEEYDEWLRSIINP